ncbi:DNA-binding response regulator [Aphanothece hegewaldii CCALA 016]|uniref:DNA-binding response regulator n=1 Tax=Aphanothece hegewaldii CCALA 016 TaxID=2107694 RepID=A0A2T1M1E3_9CHRO|nr:DNA-binding response regulator [Aphanothece hegewaldii]PSF38513.1 DNA-binding response regulator [Aphanothece hegewaldii CCALA 016]
MADILLIEDDSLNRHLFQEFLESKGFRIISAEDGISGIQQARQYLPDLILCDIIMPEIDGYSVLSQLRQDPTTSMIPLIFMTAKKARIEYRQAMELGADDYLTKPLTPEELLGAISARLQRKTMLERCYLSRCQQALEEVHKDDNSLSTSITTEQEIESIFPINSSFKEVFDFIEANYHREISLSDVARSVGYSPAYLTNQLKQETGRTVNRWIIERRLVEACNLLKNTKWAVEQIAITVGYSNASYFFRQFRQYRGMTPKAWQEKNKSV